MFKHDRNPLYITVDGCRPGISGAHGWPKGKKDLSRIVPGWGFPRQVAATNAWR